MRVPLLGSTGVLGRAVQAVLTGRHEIIAASRSGPTQVADLDAPASLAALLDRAAPLDAVICTAGESKNCPLAGMTDEALVAGVRTKLLGQVALARLAFERSSNGGSVTLTAGILNHRPIRGGTCTAVANGALEGFVRAAALEAPRDMRINAVSPSILEESWPVHGRHFAGFAPVAAAEVAQAYRRSVEGAETGQVLLVP